MLGTHSDRMASGHFSAIEKGLLGFLDFAKDAKIAFAKMQAGEYNEEAAQKKLEDRGCGRTSEVFLVCITMEG